MKDIKWKDNEVVDAKLDENLENRYLLTCTWESIKPSVTFILLNPSVGRVEAADRTLRRCVNFSKSWGYASMKIVNLFSQITTDHKKLRTPDIEETTENNMQINKAISNTDCVVFGWGGGLTKNQKVRANEIIGLVPEVKQFCIKKGKNEKFPRHPLYLSAGLKPVSWDIKNRIF